MYRFGRRWQLVASGWHHLAFSASGIRCRKPLHLHTSDRVHRAASCCGRNRLSRNPSSDGFLCSSEHSKVCIELLDTFRVTPENLGNGLRFLASAKQGLRSALLSAYRKRCPCRGWAVPPKSGSPDLEPAVGSSAVAYVAQPLNP